MFEIDTASDYRDLLERLNTFLTATGSAFGLTYQGTGNGTLTGYKGGSASISETWTIECSDADISGSEIWDITGSETGMIGGTATTGEAFTDVHLAFLITAGSTRFVTGDRFTFSTAPKWISRRHSRGALVTASGGTSGQYACDNVIDGKLAYDSIRTWTPGTAPRTLQFDFPAALTIVEYAIRGPYTQSYAPRTWTFEYWDGSAWQVLDTRTNITSWGLGELKVFTLASTHSATRVRLNITVGNSTTLNVDAVQLRTVVNGPDVAMSQYIWEAPGNDGGAAIIVGAHAFQRTDVDYYDWELCAFTGFSAALPFYTQPGYHGRLWLPLLNSSIPYWFVADGRHVKIVAKVGTQYESAYMGFLEPFFTPEQVPYPIVLGGSLTINSTDGLVSWNNILLRYSNSTNGHRAFTHSDDNTWGYLYAAQTRARRPDGTWASFFASSDDSFTAPTLTHGWLWPLSHGMTNLDVCIDGSYALFPLALSDTTPNHWGQFSGISVLSGQGLSAETLIRTGAVDHLVVPNITRTDRNDFFAMRLD